MALIPLLCRYLLLLYFFFFLTTSNWPKNWKRLKGIQELKWSLPRRALLWITRHLKKERKSKPLPPSSNFKRICPLPACLPNKLNRCIGSTWTEIPSACVAWQIPLIHHTDSRSSPSTTCTQHVHNLSTWVRKGKNDIQFRFIGDLWLHSTPQPASHLSILGPRLISSVPRRLQRNSFRWTESNGEQVSREESKAAAPAARASSVIKLWSVPGKSLAY